MKEMEKFVNILATNLAFVKRRRYRRSTVTTLMPYSYAAENICEYNFAELSLMNHVSTHFEAVIFKFLC